MWSPKHKKRFAIGLGIVVVTAGLAAILLITLKENIQLYFTPYSILQKEAPVNRPIRVGGMVVQGSIQREDSLNVSFVLTDGRGEVRVHYHGALPDLFKEGQGVVALGTLTPSGELKAVQVLAKHDENYMPKEVADSLKQVKHGS